MAAIYIKASAEELIVNGHSWSSRPSVEDLCKALPGDSLVGGEFLTAGGKNEWQYKYFDALGISIMETLSSGMVQRLTIHFEIPPKKKDRSPYGPSLQRPTKNPFEGILEINGRKIQRPLPVRHFPVKGDLPFFHQMAYGGVISAILGGDANLVEDIGFSWENDEE